MIEFRHHPDRTVAILVKEHEDTWQPISFSDLYIRAFDMGSGFVEVQIKHEDDIDWNDEEVPCDCLGLVHRNDCPNWEMPF